MPAPRPSVFNINSGTPFLETLMLGLKKMPPHDLQSALILLPTRRACTQLRDLFLMHQGMDNGATLLPTIRQLSMVEEDELMLLPDAQIAHAFLEIPPAIAPMRRRLLLTQLILAQKEPDVSHEQAFLLAGDLGQLIDQVLIENCDFKNLEIFADKDLAQHWQKIIRFLSIVTDHWPAILAAEGLIETVDRRKRLIQLEIDVWKKHPPSFPVIAAGSTGSHPSTADLLQVIAQLPKGAVILPGLDQYMDEESWNAISHTHPQYLLKKLVKKFKIECGDIPLWGPHAPVNPSRQSFLSNVMRPAEASDAWEHVGHEHIDDAPWHGMQSLTAQHEQEEAVLAALIIRKTLETPDMTVGLITPDRSLALRVTATLRRWDIQVDDSAGTPLAQTSRASFFALLLSLPRSDLKPSDLMAFLKHIDTHLGMERSEELRLARALEKDFFRAAIRGQGLKTWLALAEPMQEYTQLLTTLTQAIKNFPAEYEMRPLTEWLEGHLHLAQRWSKDTIWQGAEGEALAQYMENLRNHAAGYRCTFNDYCDIFIQGLRTQTLRISYGQHPRVHILGLIEARMLNFDHVILAGLNEGTWPETPALDPWMAPHMRVQFGLPHPDQHIGQTAHDFIELAAQPQVTLLRCERSGGTPTTPSRWLLRLETALKTLGVGDALIPGLSWQAWAKMLDNIDVTEPCAPPAVAVPVTALPKKLSATNIELWITDPYAFYAKKVLRLRALGDLDAELGAMEQGNIFHHALDALAKKYPDHWPREARDIFIELLGDGFSANGCSPDQWQMMQPRINVLANEVWDFEKQRRSEITTFYTEKTGEMALAFQHYNPVLHAKADKIEVLNDAGLRIVDYKTGKIPSKANVQNALKPQLLVEAIIANNYGYDGIIPSMQIEIGYIAITEASALLDAKKTISLDDEDAITIHQQGLLDFIGAYLKPDALFHSAPRPAMLAPSPDYARLARVAEWSKGEIAQEDD